MFTKIFILCRKITLHNSRFWYTYQKMINTSMTDIDSIKKTLVGISKGENILDMLLEFERTLDNAELFTYKNWHKGEICDGPHINRYFFKVVLMFPMKLMPDPNGGLRLTKLGAKVSYKKGMFKRPVKVNGPQDWVDPQTKRAKMSESEIWLVTIDLPMKYITRGLQNIDDIIQKDIDKTNDELADAFDEQSMDAGLDDTNEAPPDNGGLGLGEMPPQSTEGQQ